MKHLILLASLLALVACDNSSSSRGPVTPPSPVPPPNASFDISAVNLTTAQPLSPLAVLIHDDSMQAFIIGQPASAGLEQLAESGNNSDLLAELDSSAEASGSAVLSPGTGETITLELPSDSTSGLQLTIVAMLVNTNDAITAVNGLNIASIGVGESMVIYGASYDSGTEANTETAATIPGPAGGGEGFNASRDDVSDQVTGHGGVVTSDDGLSTSVLSHQHRWDNPVARFIVTRTQ
ncbi:MAG: spondin domain-containing protein [Oceanicoccus sp.]